MKTPQQDHDVQPLLEHMKEAEERRQALQRSTPAYHEVATDIEETAREVFRVVEEDERTAEQDAGTPH
jgi:hypothetical protein